jgi:hypothetical protein
MEDDRNVEFLGTFNKSLFTILLEDVEYDERSEVDIALGISSFATKSTSTTE